MAKFLRATLAGALALGTLGLELTSAQAAMPMQPPAVSQSGIEQVRLVCGPYRCFYRRPVYRRYYRPYYRPRYYY